MVTVAEKTIIRPSFKVKTQANFCLQLEILPKITLQANNQNVPILYQDEDLAIVHKPAKMTVHPGAGTQQDTLVHSLKSQIHPLSDCNSEQRPGIIHRLDRDTEGLMLIAKNNLIHRKIAEQFQARTIYKEYHAWLCGIPAPEKGEINGFISRNRNNRKLMQFQFENSIPNARQASLSYVTIKKKYNFSLVKIILKTGRTHQIRCSFPSIHTSVVGDTSYCSRTVKKKKFSEKFGMLLVANRIQFFHPIQNKKYDFKIDLPKRFLKFEEQQNNPY